MFGFLLNVRKKNLRNIAQTHELKMLLLSASVGVLSGLLVAKVRLGLGLPGHKVFFWLTPVLINRLCNNCKIGTAVGGLFAALTAFSIGGHLAGGFTGLSMIVVGGLIMDGVVEFLKKNKISNFKTVLLVGFTAMVLNLICLSKRMMLPKGFDPHSIIGLSGFWFKLCSYLFFGFISGIAGTIIAKLIKQKKTE